MQKSVLEGTLFTMKKALILLFLFVLQTSIAQENSYQHSFTYKYTFQEDATNANTKYTEQMVLLVGKNKSVYISPVKIVVDDKRSEIKKRSGGVSEIIDFKKTLPKNRILTVHQKNLRNRKITFQDNYFLKIIEVEEDFPHFNWLIQKEKKRILGYQCQLATLNFKGRDYEAWFSTDIPLQNGPWKFGDLPGLIFEIKDSKNHHTFILEEIKNVKGEFPALADGRRVIKTTPATYAKTKKGIANEMVQMSVGESKTRLKKSLKNSEKTDNPIELKD